MAVKPAAKKAAKKPLSIQKPFTKSELTSAITEMTCLAKKQVVEIIDSLMQIIEAHISKKGPGVFVFPSLVKFRVVRKPATKARKGTNPFTGEPMTFAAKPARNIVKIKPLKRLKDLVK